MAKSGYKRFKKQEKAKVKLKAKKALLPKGQNVTDTSFSVKKIIVREQLKQLGSEELLVKKHLRVKELLARLSHHNVSMRQDAVRGLKELINTHGRDMVLDNLSSLLQGAMSLTIDKSSDVRSDTLKLLSSIFDKVTEDELSPLFPMVVCHLTCAMTHIEPDVRSDSLSLLDIMLPALPNLTSTHISTLLNHFLDLISQRPRDSGGRTLSLHLENRVTSQKWRYQVIGRLNKLFSVFYGCRNSKDQDKTSRTVRWQPNKPTYLELYSPLNTEVKKAEDNLPVKEYAEMLLPLLLDTIIEAIPKQEKGKHSSGCVIGLDIAALLQNIVEVILHIWNLLEQSSHSEALGEWFKNKFGHQLVKQLVKGRFPFSVVWTGPRKTPASKELALTFHMNRNPFCSLLNMKLCLLTFLLANPGPLWTQITQHIECSLESRGSLKPEEIEVLCQCLEVTSKEPPVADCPSLLSVIAKSNILENLDTPINRKAFQFLAKVALMYSHHLHQDEHFTTWLDSLPGLLVKPSVPLSVVQSIAAIASHNHAAFNNSLDGWIEAILDNVSRLKVTGDSGRDGLRLVIGLVYWVRDWDQALVDTVGQLIQSGSLGVRLTSHLVDLLRIKKESFENEEVKAMFEKVLSLHSS